MGSQCETNAQKRRYNISMSKRTRKPQNPEKESGEGYDQECNNGEKKSNEQKSLKQLIEGRCTLAQHFREEEKEQRLVVRPPDNQDGFGGLRLKRSTARNFCDILGHLIKVKRESYARSWRKPALSFKLIEHK